MDKKNAVANLATQTSARLRNLDWQRLTATKKQEEAAEWIQKHEKYIRCLVRQYRTNTVITFDDLMQEARIAAWKAFASYDENRVDVLMATYLWKVMDNAIKEVFRKAFAKKRQNPFNTEYIADTIYKNEFDDEFIFDGDESDGDLKTAAIFGTSDAPDDVLEDDETMKFWVKQINSLPEDLKIVMKLHINGYTQCEIARELGLSQSSVSLRLKNARIELTKVRNYWEHGDIIEEHTLESLEVIFNGEYPDVYWEAKIKELPVDLGKVVVLRIAGYPVKKIAKILDISESKVWARLSNAKLELKKYVIERVGA